MGESMQKTVKERPRQRWRMPGVGLGRFLRVRPGHGGGADGKAGDAVEVGNRGTAVGGRTRGSHFTYSGLNELRLPTWLWGAGASLRRTQLTMRQKRARVSQGRIHDTAHAPSGLGHAATEVLRMRVSLSRTLASCCSEARGPLSRL